MPALKSVPVSLMPMISGFLVWYNIVRTKFFCCHSCSRTHHCVKSQFLVLSTVNNFTLPGTWVSSSACVILAVSESCCMSHQSCSCWSLYVPEALLRFLFHSLIISTSFCSQVLLHCTGVWLTLACTLSSLCPGTPFAVVSVVNYLFWFF